MNSVEDREVIQEEQPAPVVVRLNRKKRRKGRVQAKQVRRMGMCRACGLPYMAAARMRCQCPVKVTSQSAVEYIRIAV